MAQDKYDKHGPILGHLTSNTVKQNRLFYSDVRADGFSEIRSGRYNHHLAEFYRWLNKSGDGSVDWIIDQLCIHHRGKLIGPYGNEVTIAMLRPVDKFGTDTRRTMNRYKAQEHLAATYRLPLKLVPRVMIMDFARQIFLRRIIP